MSLSPPALLMSTLLLALGVIAPTPGMPQDFQPMSLGSTPAARAQGVWQSRGYGWVLDVRPAEFALYHISRAGCSRDPRTGDFIEQFAYYRSDAPPDQLVVVMHPGENRYVFDRLARLPEACGRSDWTAPRLFEHFAASYQEHYAFFAEHGVNWESRVAAHRPLVTERTTARMLFAIFSDMLDGLEDAHVGLNTVVRGDALVFRTGRGATLQRLIDDAVRMRQSVSSARDQWLAEHRRAVRTVILSGRFQEAADGRFVWGRIGAEIGYIYLGAVEGFVPGSLADNIMFVNATMDRILSDFDGVRAVILDASVNGGGYDRLAREIAGHFAERRISAYSKRPYRTSEAESDIFFAEPSSGRRFTGPTYLLTSDATVSGAEILTMTMRVLPNVTQVGMPTRGALSDRLVKTLPDGTDFSISNEIYLDPHGELYEARGVPPHRRLEIFPANDLHGGHAKAVRQLVEWIRAGTADRNKAAAR